jgi:hypothetical protein
MELLTFRKITQTSMASVVGTCGGTAAFKELLNEATAQLMDRGDWVGTVQSMGICAYNGCITWPRYVGTVLGLVVGAQHVRPVNGWYNFLPANPAVIRGGHGLCSAPNVAIQQNFSPVFQNIVCGDAQVVAYPSLKSDAGKTMTIYGVDENGQEVFTKRADGTWQHGVVLTLAVPFGTVALKLQKITRVSREKTQGPVRCYQLFADGSMVDLAYYDGSEENPSYRQTLVNAFKGYACCRDSKLTTVEALVKMEFVPVVSDDDIVQVTNVTALKTMIQAIRKRDANDPDEAAKYEALAIRELNRQLWTKYPIEQRAVSVYPMSGRPQTQQCRVF